MKTLTRREVERWLFVRGFREVPQKATGHRQFIHNGDGAARRRVKVTLLGHGRREVSEAHRGAVMRALVKAGWDRAEVRGLAEGGA